MTRGRGYARDLFEHDHDGAGVVADAAPLLGDRHAEEALLGQLGDASRGNDGS
jgi:hypothetical protein